MEKANEQVQVPQVSSGQGNPEAGTQTAPAAPKRAPLTPEERRAKKNAALKAWREKNRDKYRQYIKDWNAKKKAESGQGVKAKSKAKASKKVKAKGTNIKKRVAKKATPASPESVIEAPSSGA